MIGVLAISLAMLLAFSGLHKLLAFERMRPIVARLTGTPVKRAGFVVLAMAATELCAAAALIVPVYRSLGSSVALLLWSGYGLALLRQRGASLDCGCELFARERPVDAFAICRPLFLAVMALVIQRANAGSSAPMTIDAPLAGLAFVSLWFAAAEIHSIPHSRSARS